VHDRRAGDLLFHQRNGSPDLVRRADGDLGVVRLGPGNVMARDRCGVVW
jgi:hypothetical protein